VGGRVGKGVRGISASETVVTTDRKMPVVVLGHDAARQVAQCVVQ
jgi:hypothetical protein